MSFKKETNAKWSLKTQILIHRASIILKGGKDTREKTRKGPDARLFLHQGLFWEHFDLKPADSTTVRDQMQEVEASSVCLGLEPGPCAC
jgi:hypothetical protein